MCIKKKKKLQINTCFSFISEVNLSCWQVLYLLNFNTADMVSFDTKYLLIDGQLMLDL